MILYLDTSALVKLYVEEPGSRAVVAAVEEAAGVATVRVTYAEARATFARLQRERRLTAAERRRCVEYLDEDWEGMTVVDVSEAIVRRAGVLAERRRLRGYDAIQLGAALELHLAGRDVTFACADGRLARAARRERLRVAGTRAETGRSTARFH